MTFYEIYYTYNGETIYCGDVDTEQEAINEITELGNEWVDHKYWYEAVHNQ